MDFQFGDVDLNNRNTVVFSWHRSDLPQLWPALVLMMAYYRLKDALAYKPEWPIMGF